MDGVWLKNVVTRAKNSSESLSSSAEAEGWASHNWEGEVKVDKGISVGGFRVGEMSVKVDPKLTPSVLSLTVFAGLCRAVGHPT